MSRLSTFYLVPSLFKTNVSEGLRNSGQALASVWSPRDNSILIHPTLAPDNIPGPSRSAEDLDEPILNIASINTPSELARRSFLTDTLVIFTALRLLAEIASTKDRAQHKELEIQKKKIKLADDYVNHCKLAWAEHSKNPSQSTTYNGEHYRIMHTTLSLFVVLYLPAPGHAQSMVGEPLLEWLNHSFVDPPSNEGDALSALERPWEDPNFWPYVARATLRGLSQAAQFFIGTLAGHPSTHVQKSAMLLTPLIADQPRAFNYATEREFKAAHRRWRDAVRLARVELDRVPEKERDDGFENWWRWMSDIVGLLEGRAEVLSGLATEIGADWKDVLAAWTVFIRPETRRDDLPDVLENGGLEADPYDLEDQLHFSLMMGVCPKALELAAQHDPWLAAHLADLMEADVLVDEDKARGESVRDHYILEYAEYTRSDPGLWRLTKEYLYTCGLVGQARGDELLLRVPLQLASGNDGANLNGNLQENGDIAGVLYELMDVCATKRREDVRRQIIRTGARWFLERKIFHRAIFFYISAEYWKGIGHAVDGILDEFIGQGPNVLVDLVEKLEPSGQIIERGTATSGVFGHRLQFVIFYADFHGARMKGALRGAADALVRLFDEGIAPRTWWGVLLLDALPLLNDTSALLFTMGEVYELLFRIQELDSAVAQGAGADYLEILMRVLKVKNEKDAVARLRPVRLALARYSARCALVGAGGRDTAPLASRSVIEAQPVVFG